MKAFLVFTFLFFTSATFLTRDAHTATRLVSGKVIGFDDSLPIEGVTVAIRGKQRATGTQVDGTFYIRVQPPEDSVLVFSASGYQRQELKLNSRNDYEVALERAN